MFLVLNHNIGHAEEISTEIPICSHINYSNAKLLTVYDSVLPQFGSDIIPSNI